MSKSFTLSEREKNTFYNGLKELQKKLIDTSRRNKLINYRFPHKSRSLKIIDESPDFIFQHLIEKESKFKFLSIPEPEIDFTEVERLRSEKRRLIITAEQLADKDTTYIQEQIQSLDLEIKKHLDKKMLTPEERAQELNLNISKELPRLDLDNEAIDKKYTDQALQTLHYPGEMEKILSVIERQAKSFIEETGSNVLYLSLGFLHWSDAQHSEEINRSPLLCIPITIKKIKSIHQFQFTIEYSQEGLDSNQSLAEKLSNDYGIILPELNEESTYGEYIEKIKSSIVGHTSWQVKHEISLDFLHFGKILMYQDLKEELWDKNSFIDNTILQEIFLGRDVSCSVKIAQDYEIDSHEKANSILLATDADSSQHSAIVDVLEGDNVIIEGPPGTGKSQTITNIIAALMAEGKSVLFVSEKLAALEVVYKRLSHLGLSDFCLELHSHKSQKATVLKSIEQRMCGVYQDVQTLSSIMGEIEQKKKELREYVEIIHQDFGNFGCSIYDILWRVERYQYAAEFLTFKVSGVSAYSYPHYKEILKVLDHYVNIHTNYDLSNCYWKGVDTHKLNFSDKDDFIDLFIEIRNIFKCLKDLFIKLPCSVENPYLQLQNIKELIPQLPTQKVSNFDLWIKNISQSPEGYKRILNHVQALNDESLGVYQELQHFHEIVQFNSVLKDKIRAVSSMLSTLNQEINLPVKGELLYLETLLNATRLFKQVQKEHYVKITNQCGSSHYELLLEEVKKTITEIIFHETEILSPFDLAALLACSFEELHTSETVFIDKMDSLFKIFSKEYGKSKKHLSSILKVELPSDKKICLDYFKRAKNYKKIVEELEKNEDYKQLFSLNFKGKHTDVEMLQTMHEWGKKFRKSIKNIELQAIFLSGNDLVYESITSQSHIVEEALSNLDKHTQELFNFYGPQLSKHLELNTYGTIDVFQIMSKLEFFEGYIESSQQLYYKFFNKQEVPTQDKLIEVFLKSDIEILEQLQQQFSLMKSDLALQAQRKIHSIIDLKKNIQDISLAHHICQENIFNEKDTVYQALQAFNFIETSALPNTIKKVLCDEYTKTEEILKEINAIYEKLSTNIYAVEKYGSLTPVFFGDNSFNLDYCIEKLDNLEANQSMLMIWSDYQRFTQELHRLGLSEIVFAHEQELLPLDMLVPSLNYNFFNTLAKEFYREYPIMNRFSRLSHEQAIEKFKSLDKEWIEKARKKIAYLATQKDIPQGYRGGSKKDLTQLSLILNEISKKKRHIPLRQLIKRSSGALKALKPCFMMSPLSVAQYLPAQDITFDVLIIDEASQLRPEEAVGAIARVKQIVIVGDPKQLPPTSFFDALDKSEEENESIIGESESILDFCLNLYQPIRQLKWHYRSQHESLIDFSNKQFYDGNLIVFPSPTIVKNDQLGVKHHYIKEAFYHDRKNKLEAKQIIDALEQQMKRFPNCTVGVGTFNTDQRDFIQGMMDEREKTSPVVSNFISKWSETNEPFFIKNLESLQGDERDVIFISTTFGKDKETQRVYQRFGPINSDVGWRRLNVLFTRAKQKMEIFTSMQSSDIIISPNSSRGVIALKAFLNYAETGQLSSNVILTKRDFDSEFEIAVSRLLSDSGYTVVPQVGVAGYFIDLAVVSKNNPNEYVLGIECDGATYHSSKSARDRDRLKQEVLEKLGWNIHRIWSVDWFKNRDNEVKKLLEVIQQAQQKYSKFSATSIVVALPLKDEEDELIAPIIEHKQEPVEVKQIKRQFSSDQIIKDELIAFRDNIIAKQYKIDTRCLLSPLMIDLFIKHKPLDMDEFRSEIPLKIRQSLDSEQLVFINHIFEILEKADE